MRGRGWAPTKETLLLISRHVPLVYYGCDECSAGGLRGSSPFPQVEVRPYTKPPDPNLTPNSDVRRPHTEPEPGGTRRILPFVTKTRARLVLYGPSCAPRLLNSGRRVVCEKRVLDLGGSEGHRCLISVLRTRSTVSSRGRYPLKWGRKNRKQGEKRAHSRPDVSLQ